MIGALIVVYFYFWPVTLPLTLAGLYMACHNPRR
jgi:hypothetical protein